MKLKSVSTYCQSAMSAGLIYTRDESGEIIRQHLVCRQMIVPLDGMPVISGDQLPALLDVPEEKRDAWFVSRIERDEGTGKELSWMLEDRQPGDIPAILLPMTLAVNDVIVQPVMDEAGVARMQFVRVDALKVTDDIKKGTHLRPAKQGRTYRTDGDEGNDRAGSDHDGHGMDQRGGERMAGVPGKRGGARGAGAWEG